MIRHVDVFDDSFACPGDGWIVAQRMLPPDKPDEPDPRSVLANCAFWSAVGSLASWLLVLLLFRALGGRL